MFFFATIVFAALVLLRCEIVCHAQEPAAAAPAAEAPAEPQVPIMMREFREIREAPGPDGDMVPIEENRSSASSCTPMLTSGKFTTPEDQKLFDDFYPLAHCRNDLGRKLCRSLAEKRVKFKKLGLGRVGQGRRANSPRQVERPRY